MTCEQRQDLLLLYAADALDATETQELRIHLQSGCPKCAGYLAEAQAVFMSLPLGLDPVAPPAGLKEKLMQRIDAEDSNNAVDEKSIMAPAPLRLFRYLIPAALAAGVAIAITHTLMLQQVSDLQRQANIWQERSQTATTEIQQLHQSSDQFKSQTQMVEMLHSPGLKLIPLQPSALQPHAVANLLWDQKGQEWAILATGMTPAAAGQTYELWFVTQAGAKIPAGTFDVDSNGNGSLRVPIPKGIGELKLAAVTNEKAGGVQQPQGNFQVTGSVE